MTPHHPSYHPEQALNVATTKTSDVSTRRSFLRTLVAGILASQMNALTAGSAQKNEGPAEGTEAYEKLSEAARLFFAEKLRTNRESADVFHEMLPTIKEFATFAGVKVEVCKCMDGRLHGNDHKGLPPTFASNRRSQGNVIDVGQGNKDLWDGLNEAAFEAKSQGVPLLIISSAHRGELGSSCAAHKRPQDELPSDGDNRALAAVREQSLELRSAFGKTRKDVQVLSAMTNTDTGAMTFYTRDPLFDSEKMMATAKLRDARDVYEGTFMAQKITDAWAHPSIKDKTPYEILIGSTAPFFTDMRTKIAFESYLIRRIAETKPKIGDGIIRPDILEAMQSTMEKNVNPNLTSFLTYMWSMNLAHACHRRNENTALIKKGDKETLKTKVEHAEKVLGYGFGYDLDKPNSVILVKPGGGNDEHSVRIGRDVLAHNLDEMKLTESLPPLVHINIELKAPINAWSDYRNIMARLQTKLGIVKKEFGNHVRVLTTYSYHQDTPTGEGGIARVKEYFPLNADPENKAIVVTPEQNVGSGMLNRETFSATKLRERETLYTETGAAVAPQKKDMPKKNVAPGK